MDPFIHLFGSSRIELSIYSQQRIELVSLFRFFKADTTGGVCSDLQDADGNKRRLYNFNIVAPSPFGGVLNVPIFEFISDNKTRSAMANALGEMVAHYNYYFSASGGRKLIHFDGYKWIFVDCDWATMDVK